MSSRLPLPATAAHAAAPSARPTKWHFDLDHYLNPFIPPSPARHLPRLVARFLGFRDGPVPPVGSLVAIAWTFLGVFAAVAAANFTLAHVATIQDSYHRNILQAEPARNPVFSVGIFGAAAVLEFYAIDSPYAQPRSVVGGQLVASVVGVAIAKVAAVADPDPVRRAGRRWLAGALSTAVSACVMALTGTVHPPAGATALIAVTDNGAMAVGWFLVPAVVLGAVVTQLLALVINNIQRRYPLYWWTPEETGQAWKRLRHKRTDSEKAGGAESSSSANEQDAYPTTHEALPTPPTPPGPAALRRGNGTETHGYAPALVISHNSVTVPSSLYLLPDEIHFLEALSERL